MGQGNCGIVVPLATAECRRLHYYGFVSFHVGCTLDSVLAYLAYRHSAEPDWAFLGGAPSVSIRHCWSRVYPWVEAGISLQKRMQAGHLVWIRCLLLKMASGWRLPQIFAILVRVKGICVSLLEEIRR